MMASSVFNPTHFDFSFFPLHYNPSIKLKPNSIIRRRITRQPKCSSLPLYTVHHHRHSHHLKLGRGFSYAFPAEASSGDGGFPLDVSFEERSSVPEAKPENSSCSSSTADSGDSYLPLFVRMLGLDNDRLDREHAVVSIWKYSLGGKEKIDRIMQFSGCVNLIINLLKSQSSSACEAAAALLRAISAINSYRDVVAESGAVEELIALVTRSSLTSEVKEQSLCALWNLSANERLRVKMANSDLLPLLIKFLDDEIEQVKEAAGGVLANLALTQSNHDILLEAGVIPKLAKFLTREVEGSKIIRREAKTALLEFAKDEYYKITIMEEGLLLVPLVGAAAFESFRPTVHSWPSLPDGTEIKRAPKVPSRYGASELLVGLSKEGNDVNLDESKVDAIVGRTQQQFLARLKAIENENENPASGLSSSTQYTLLPWKDGVARLVLILELKDDSAIARAANSIADASISEKIRIMFKEAGGIKILVRLLDHDSDAVRTAATNALEKLSMSNVVCRVMEDEGIVSSLVRMLKDSALPENVAEKTLSILARILDPSKEMKSKFFTAPVNGTKNLHGATNLDATGELAGSTVDRYQSNITAWKDELDSTVIARLVEILKTAYPRLQIKAASILEFMTMVDSLAESIVASDVGSGLAAAFEQKVLNDMDSDLEDLQPEQRAADLEEAGLAVSAASRLLTKLLDSDTFHRTINVTQFKNSLRKVLKSEIPLQYKEWVAASLVKLAPSSLPLENPISNEVTLYETIPRLINQIKNSTSRETQEAAAMELNRIVSEGVVDATQAVVAQGGVPPLVKLIEGGTERAVEAGLAILYNLSMDSENHAGILASGAVDVLRRIVALQRPQWQRALRLLRTLPV